MCGIAGIITENIIDKGIVKKMLLTMQHRGPDKFGYYSDQHVNAGMCRLSINDIEGGDQPLYNENKEIVVLYNGEIYNSPELRQFLQNKGHAITTHCDGDVIAHLYEEVGEDFLSWLDGMFAIFLYDRCENKLILARDIPGEKPLYYCQSPSGNIIFASEIKAIYEAEVTQLTLNPQAIWDLPTFLWIPEPATIFNEIRALPRSSYAVIRGKKIIEKTYGFRDKPSIDYTDEKEVIEFTRNIVEKSVKSRLLSDVSIGAFLSSGLDSSIICTLAAKSLNELHTFTISVEDKSPDPYHGNFNEAQLAEKYASMIGTKHTNIPVSDNKFYSLLNKFVRYADQPFSVSSGLGVLAIAQEAHERGIRILLTGDGADEVFGGYPWYSYLQKSNDTQSKSDGLHDVSSQYTSMNKIKRIQKIKEHPAHKQAWAWHYYASERDKSILFNKEYFVDQTQSSLRIFKNYKKSTDWQRVDFIKQDRDCYLPFEMLRKVDRMTMAFSVEGRVPFVAPMILKHVENLRYGHFIKGQTQKACLRKAFADILPMEIVNRPKHGFNIPIDHWLKNGWNSLLEHTFSRESVLYKLGIIHEKSAREAQHMLYSTECLHGHTLFSFIALNLWLENNLLKTTYQLKD